MQLKQFKAVVLSNIRIARDFYEMQFLWDKSVDTPKAGQFITIRVSKTTSPLLRRPFAIASYNHDTSVASIIFRKIGTSTQLLAGKISGEYIDCIGPLGNNFCEPMEGKKAILIAGGTGLGPMLFWSAQLLRQSIDVHFLFGCKTKDYIPQNSIFRTASPIIATLDGSHGFKGTVVDILNSMSSIEVVDAELYCCGPMAMLKACHDFAASKGLRCWVSIEQVMACGVGACMGCAIKIKQHPGFARVCKEGPIFNSETIQWT